MKPTHITADNVHKIAALAQIPLSQDEEERLAKGFTTTLNVVHALDEVDVTKVEPTHQVTGLENIYREDEVDGERMFTQEQAISDATETHNGYFVVPQILDQA